MKKEKTSKKTKKPLQFAQGRRDDSSHCLIFSHLTLIDECSIIKNTQAGLSSVQFHLQSLCGTQSSTAITQRQRFMDRNKNWIFRICLFLIFLRCAWQRSPTSFLPSQAGPPAFSQLPYFSRISLVFHSYLETSILTSKVNVTAIYLYIKCVYCWKCH